MSRPLESTIAVPNGGTATRCQAHNRAGTQCLRPARAGFTVCGKHGAGTKKREDARECKPAGRPVIHGLYSKTSAKSISEIMLEVESLKADLDSSDKEMVALKAILWFLLGQSDKFLKHAEVVEKALLEIEDLCAREATLEAGVLRGAAVKDMSTAKAVMSEMRTGQRFLSELSSYTDRLTETAMKIVTAVKSRAETKAKLAEKKALEYFVRLARDVKEVIYDLNLDEEQLDAFEEEMKRRVFGPNRIEPI